MIISKIYSALHQRLLILLLQKPLKCAFHIFLYIQFHSMHSVNSSLFIYNVHCTMYINVLEVI